MSAFRPTFVSHAHVDNELCDRYVEALRERGVDLWYDRDNTQYGRMLSDQLARELDSRSALVVFLTPHTQKSSWVKLEVDTYLGLWSKDPTRMILWVRIAECEDWLILNSFLGINAYSMPFEEAIDAIVGALADQGKLGPEPAPAPSGASSTLHQPPLLLTRYGFRGYTVNKSECVLPPLCLVPEGEFLMGSDKQKDPQARDFELPQHRLALPAFQIAAFPVTVTEYACFVRTGQQQPQNWQDQLAHPDHPVANISWQDAMGYAAWLARLTGQSWQIPNEAEWEKAARWNQATGQGYIYPWEDYFDGTRCNTDESGIGETTPIGNYPQGASPCGAQEMTGGVWEWTSGRLVPYPYVPNNGGEDRKSTEQRVLRGGSWGVGAWLARTAYRRADRPDAAGIDYGFRLICNRAIS